MSEEVQIGQLVVIEYDGPSSHWGADEIHHQFRELGENHPFYERAVRMGRQAVPMTHRLGHSIRNGLFRVLHIVETPQAAEASEPAPTIKKIEPKAKLIEMAPIGEPEPDKPLTVTQLRKLAREKDIDVSDIKGKGAAARIAERLEG